MVDFKRALDRWRALKAEHGEKLLDVVVETIRKVREIEHFEEENGLMQGDAKQLLTLWETKRDDMMTGEIKVELLENLVKAAKIGGFPCVKFLAFKNLSPTGKKLLNVLADPCHAYVKPGTEGKSKIDEKKKTASW